MESSPSKGTDEALCFFFSKFANFLQRKRTLKMVDNDDGRMPAYKLTCEPLAQVSKKNGYIISLIFHLKHRLWVLVSEAVPMCTAIHVFSKNIKNISFFLRMKYSIFTAEKNLCIFHGQVFVMPNILDSSLSLCNGE